MGWKIVEQPAKAHAELTVLFAKHKEVGVVAAKMGVDRDTVRRWVNRLIQAGFKDPRGLVESSGKRTA
jgi:hypothetical protein